MGLSEQKEKTPLIWCWKHLSTSKFNDALLHGDAKIELVLRTLKLLWIESHRVSETL